MSTIRRGAKGFTLIELLIVVAILGILAAVVVPNVGRFIGRGETEAQKTELHDIQAAVTALMVENGLAAIPNPIKYLLPTSTNATKDMTVFPDILSGTTGYEIGKVKDPAGFAYDYVGGDKAGYLLSTHDISAVSNPVQPGLVNYVNMKATRFYYTAEADGTVRQWKDTLTSPANELASK